MAAAQLPAAGQGPLQILVPSGAGGLTFKMRKVAVHLVAGQALHVLHAQEVCSLHHRRA